MLLCTSQAVRVEMRGWVLSDEGHRWTDKLDARDIGGHLDTTLRGWSSTLSLRVRLVISRLDLNFALPLDFYGRVRIVRAIFVLCALHGVEASYLSKGGFLKLRAAVMRAVWSRKQPLANSGAVPGLLDGPHGCDPSFCIVWFRLRLFGRCLSFRPTRFLRCLHFLILFEMAVPVMVLFMLLLLVLVVLASQHFRSAVFDAWRNKVAADLCSRRGFRGGPVLDIPGSHQLLNSSHVRERDKALLRSIMVGGVWNGFLLGKVRGQDVPCQFCGGTDGDGHLFWECPYPPLVEIRENPEFHDLMRMDKSHWPRCLLWQGLVVGHLGLLVLKMLLYVCLKVL